MSVRPARTFRAPETDPSAETDPSPETDPSAGPRAVEDVVRALESALAARWKVPVLRDPALLCDLTTSDLAASGEPVDVLLSAPGICARPDVIDGHHAAEPHQVGLWRIRVGGEPLGVLDLLEMVDLAVAAVLPRHRWTAHPAVHPDTVAGRQIDVHPLDQGSGAPGFEIGGCGLTHPGLLADVGLPHDTTGLAMGLRPDRLTLPAEQPDGARPLRSLGCAASGRPRPRRSPARPGRPRAGS